MPRPKRTDGRKPRTVANAKYNKGSYDRPAVFIKAGNLSIIKEYAQKNGETVNSLINRLLAEEVPGFIPLDKKQ